MRSLIVIICPLFITACSVSERVQIVDQIVDRAVETLDDKADEMVTKAVDQLVGHLPEPDSDRGTMASVLASAAVLLGHRVWGQRKGSYGNGKT